GIEHLWGISVPSIFPDFTTMRHGGIWRFSVNPIYQTPVRLRLPPSLPKRAKMREGPIHPLLLSKNKAILVYTHI
ncbi:MAG: hypothetical protein IIW34_03080, partial [Clostridia bacterium]|nr:hypothetical protein [Clostridia bacterium]